MQSCVPVKQCSDLKHPPGNAVLLAVCAFRAPKSAVAPTADPSYSPRLSLRMMKVIRVRLFVIIRGVRVWAIILPRALESARFEVDNRLLAKGVRETLLQGP